MDPIEKDTMESRINNEIRDVKSMQTKMLRHMARITHNLNTLHQRLPQTGELLNQDQEDWQNSQYWSVEDDAEDSDDTFFGPLSHKRSLTNSLDNISTALNHQFSVTINQGYNAGHNAGYNSPRNNKK